ncbi:MAG: glycosyltransferase family 4 protein [Verrucomicrobiae bacterium]|nr:glycosyltransferase family 4 protein [Verrucomicrobiae bacterium]MDW7981085.1 glycosyltransferase family 4 protein [Verrucomicrobiales bacterium]
MRVLHVITRLIIGGAQENTIASVRGLRQRHGVEARLLCGPDTGAEGSLQFELADQPGVLEVIPALTRPICPWKDTLALVQLFRAFKRWTPDIVHTHSGKAGFLGRLAAAWAKVPVIIHTIHGPSFGPFQGVWANLALRTAERIAGGVTTHFVCVADAMAKQYLAAGIGTPGQYTTIRSGFDLRPYLEASNDPALRQKFGFGPGDFVVGKIARLFKLKGHEDLFAIAPELVAKCPQIKFLLVGDGPWRARFERRLARLGLQQHFAFAGLVRPDQVPQLVGIMDAVVHLSRREGLPRALPQALAAGKPVVAYDCDGAGEVCIPGETGFLVRPGDLCELARRILQLVAEPALRAKFGQRGRALVQDQFGVETMIDRLYELYQRLVRTLPASPAQARPA